MKGEHVHMKKGIMVLLLMMSVVLESSFIIPVKAAVMLDGNGEAENTGASSSVSVSLTTANTNDVIMALFFTYNEAAHAFSSIADTAGLTWTLRSLTHNPVDSTQSTFRVYWAKATSTLSTDSITVTMASNTYITLMVFGVSGANTVSPFDSHASLPAIGTGHQTAPSVTFSTSNANDFLIGAYSSSDTGYNTPATPDTGFTLLNQNQGTGAATAADEYKIVSATQSSLTLTLVAASFRNYWIEYGDAIQQASAVTVTQAIKTTTTNFFPNPTPTMSVSGCGVSNATFSGDGYFHTYTGLTPSCTITVTPPTDMTNTRHRLRDGNVLPAVAVTTWSIVTCASGTCASASNITYYQARNLDQATPAGPTIWDAVYTIKVKGSFVGVASSTCGSIVTTTGGGAASNQIWCDSQSLGVVPLTFDSPVGAWTAFPSGSNIIYVDAGGTVNVNYRIAGAIGDDTSMWIIPAFLGILLWMRLKKEK